MKTIIYTLFVVMAFGLTGKAQETTAIPDPVFEQVLIEKGIDSDGLVNGQVLTSDVETISKFKIEGGYQEYTSAYIQDITGIEDFISLDTLVINDTEIQELPLGTLSQLIYLDCKHNFLPEIDVSSNPLLEDFYVMDWVDYLPGNFIEELDLSNNSNLRTLIYKTPGTDLKINLNNGNNNPGMNIDISVNMSGSSDSSFACVKVDDPEAAQNYEPPYSEWTLEHAFMDIHFTDNLEECMLSVDGLQKPKITFYPNPAEDIIHFENIDRPYELRVYNLSGKILLEQNLDRNSATANISRLSAGLYFYKLSSEKGIAKSGRLVKK